MNKLTKTQRDQLIGIAAGTVALMAALWYFGVTAKQEELSKTEGKTAQMMDTLKKAEDTIRKTNEVAEKLAEHSQLLGKSESMLVDDRDDLAWIIQTINDIKRTSKGVNFVGYDKAVKSEAGILPGFPYTWATFKLGFSGYYHDLGKFIADLENNYPYYRVQNLDLKPDSTAGAEPERLSLTFELVVPIKASEAK